MITPITPRGLRQFDHLAPVQAAIQAWYTAGANESWHHRAQLLTWDAMPSLARALDDADTAAIQAALRASVPPLVRNAMPLLARAADRARDQWHICLKGIR